MSAAGIVEGIECPTCKRPRYNPPCPRCGIQLAFFWNAEPGSIAACYCGFRYYCPGNASDAACFNEQGDLMKQTTPEGVALTCEASGTGPAGAVEEEK